MNKIKLDNYENVAYWWVKLMKNGLNFIEQKEELTTEEQEYVDIFSQFDAQDWRELYINLSLDVKAYFDFGNKKFFQCSEAGCHNKMNRFVDRNIGVEVPDVSLSKNLKSIVVAEGKVLESYEDDYKFVKNEYVENYILTGDEKLLTKTLVSA